MRRTLPVLALFAIALASITCTTNPTPVVVTVVVEVTAPPAPTLLQVGPTSPPPPTEPPPTPPPLTASGACADSVVGQSTTCRIARAYCDYRPDVEGAPTFCNDAPYPSNSFTLLIWGEDWSDYDGKCLDVTGLVVRYKGKPEIVATSRSQVELCR
jgi:hypothetical protein